MTTELDKYHRPPEAYRADTDFVIITAPIMFPPEQGVVKPCIIKVKSQELCRWSTVFADMLQMGTVRDEEKVDGLPFVTLTEGYPALKKFLTFFSPDHDEWTKGEHIGWESRFELLQMANKYNVPHVSYIMEMYFVKDRAAIPAQDTFKYYIFAVNRGRKALAEALLPATMRGDISKVEKSVLCALPASDLYELLHYKGKPSVLKTIAGHAKVVVEEADKSHEDVALSGGARAYKFADSRRACRLAGEAIVKLTTAQ